MALVLYCCFAWLRSSATFARKRCIKKLLLAALALVPAAAQPAKRHRAGMAATRIFWRHSGVSPPLLF